MRKRTFDQVAVTIAISKIGRRLRTIQRECRAEGGVGPK
jgi:hypothetical protein